MSVKNIKEDLLDNYRPGNLKGSSFEEKQNSLINGVKKVISDCTAATHDETQYRQDYRTFHEQFIVAFESMEGKDLDKFFRQFMAEYSEVFQIAAKPFSGRRMAFLRSPGALDALGRISAEIENLLSTVQTEVADV